MTYSRSLYPVLNSYKIGDESLARVDDKKDLGVIFDSKLEFDLHINAIVSKANSILGFVKRNSSDFRDPYTVKSLFCCLVRPIIEYCSVVWNPTTLNCVIRIERVQKSFLRFALRHFVMNNEILLNYKSRCKLLGMQNLEQGRKIFDVMFIRDILCSTIKCGNLLSLINIYAPSRSLRSRPLLFEMPHTTCYGQREPISRCCHLFNSVYDNFDLYVSRDIFKKNLRFIFLQFGD